MAERPRARVLVADRIDRDPEAWLAQRYDVVRLGEAGSEALHKELPGCDGLIVRTTKVPRTALEGARRLRVIAKHGTGTDNIDVATATDMGILVTNCPGGNAPSVAEFTLTLILLMLRPVVAGADWLRSNSVTGSLVVATENAGLVGREVSSQTIGVVGWGEIGRRVGLACAGLGAKVLAYDPEKARAELEADGVRATSTLNELFQESDVVTLHVPLTSATTHLIGRAQLAQMSPDAALVNVARGGVVDEQALVEALSSGRLRCAATDVFVREPPSPDDPLLALPNALCTPHMGGTTVEAFRRIGWTVVRAVDDALSGDRPANVVNPEATRPESVSYLGT